MTLQGNNAVKYQSVNKRIIGSVGEVKGEVWEYKDCIYIEGYAIIPIEYYDKLIAFEPPTLIERVRGWFVKEKLSE
tara:strand:- start:10088 stop:10315 length:228 start_codon:yes stop_codon:yes gene_type:complete